jgi:NTP pyrophosphatase (non-canonical NTP hydrolase)
MLKEMQTFIKESWMVGKLFKILRSDCQRSYVQLQTSMNQVWFKVIILTHYLEEDIWEAIRETISKEEKKDYEI